MGANSVRAAFDCRVQRAIERVRGPAAGETQEAAELRRERADANVAELKAAQQSGKAVSLQGVESLADRLMVSCAMQLDGLGGRVAGRLSAEMDPAAVRQLLADEVQAILSALAAARREVGQ